MTIRSMLLFLLTTFLAACAAGTAFGPPTGLPSGSDSGPRAAPAPLPVPVVPAAMHESCTPGEIVRCAAPSGRLIDVIKEDGRQDEGARCYLPTDAASECLGNVVGRDLLRVAETVGGNAQPCAAGTLFLQERDATAGDRKRTGALRLEQETKAQEAAEIRRILQEREQGPRPDPHP